MRQIQKDLYSLQAEKFMELLRKDVPETGSGAVLRRWDLRYDKGSKGATVFEAVYSELLKECVGRTTFGEEVWDHMAQHTGILALHYYVFDRALLSDSSPWYLGGKRDLIRKVLKRVLGRLDAGHIPEWGQAQGALMENLFFAGKLPRWFGFDSGPIPIEGSRATIHQGGMFRVGGRLSSFGPSKRARIIG